MKVLNWKDLDPQLQGKLLASNPEYVKTLGDAPGAELDKVKLALAQAKLAREQTRAEREKFEEVARRRAMTRGRVRRYGWRSLLVAYVLGTIAAAILEHWSCGGGTR